MELIVVFTVIALLAALALAGVGADSRDNANWKAS
jgi:type II secretory pathway pseudopilin PulG